MHLSLYQLTIEPGTGFAGAVARGRLASIAEPSFGHASYGSMRIMLGHQGQAQRLASMRAWRLQADFEPVPMRALRASLGQLPSAQQQSLRDECDALSRALDVLRVPPATR